LRFRSAKRSRKTHFFFEINPRAASRVCAAHTEKIMYNQRGPKYYVIICLFESRSTPEEVYKDQPQLRHGKSSALSSGLQVMSTSKEMAKDCGCATFSHQSTCPAPPLLRVDLCPPHDPPRPHKEGLNSPRSCLLRASASLAVVGRGSGPSSATRRPRKTADRAMGFRVRPMQLFL